MCGKECYSGDVWKNFKHEIHDTFDIERILALAIAISQLLVDSLRALFEVLDMKFVNGIDDGMFDCRPSGGHQEVVPS